MTHIVTIGWGNGQGAILRHLHRRNTDEIQISAIFSMSDDGRTTWVLMKQFYEAFGVDLPPPGDIRRWFYSLSNYSNVPQLTELLETVLDMPGNIGDYSLEDICKSIGIDFDLGDEYISLLLPMEYKIQWHKFGNILTAALYYHYSFDFNKTVQKLSEMCQISGMILPITFDRALIQAELKNGDIITSQDSISNRADYNSPIKKISLVKCSHKAKINPEVLQVIDSADIIIITPGDLFTSLLSNFLFPELAANIKKNWKEVFFMLNGNNTIWETTWFTICDFIDVFYEKTWIIPDYLVGNNMKPILSEAEKIRFKNDISVKWWEYLILDTHNKNIVSKRYKDIKFISGDYIEEWSLYKLSSLAVNDMMELIKK